MTTTTSSSTSLTTNDSGRGAKVNVIYVERRNAKTVKTWLENKKLLDKDFRMCPISIKENNNNISSSFLQKCIAIPVLDKTDVCVDDETCRNMVVGDGMQYCPYSSAMLGNNNNNNRIVSLGQPQDQEKQQLNRIQQALLEALIESNNATCSARCSNCEEKAALKQKLVTSIRALSIATCPKKLELLGDDKTLIIPQRTFSLEHDADFRELLKEYAGDAEQSILMERLWRQLACIHGSPRVARRGDVDPESKVRHSGHVLLWPNVTTSSDAIGPSSPGWITVTEQGIRQSFDFTKVMFSRGNITEKIRFGRLVQEGEEVLDMYAGIGYYTLPALVHGKARHVTACEWNPNAVFALHYNLQQNGILDKATVLQGDCRVLAKQNQLVNKFDRVSLGLLPSSEGGWKTATQALRRDKGGWLHVHGNVPDQELQTWQMWMCQTLYSNLDSTDIYNDWIVCNTHVQEVKSFAPKIHHYVADVFVGPRRYGPPIDTMGQDCNVGIVHGNGMFEACPKECKAPSCALSSTGVLHQKWMMEQENDNSENCSL